MEGKPESPHPFNLRTIKQLVRLMGEHELTEIDLREGDQRVRLRRGPQGVVTTEVAPVGAAPAASSVQAQPSTTEEKPPATNYTEIKSPTPGTFYPSPNPEAEAFVKVGDKVEATTVVCIIEAMKVFNEITADCNGTIAAVLVENQQPVEYGQALFRVEPN